MMEVFRWTFLFLFVVLVCTDIIQASSNKQQQNEDNISEEEEGSENSANGKKSKEEVEEEYRRMYPEEYSDGVQGDMIMTPKELEELKDIVEKSGEINSKLGKFRGSAFNAVYCNVYCWKYYGTGIVYYYVTSNFRNQGTAQGNGTHTPLAVLRAAMDAIEEVACVNFIEYKAGDTPRPYYVLVDYGTGCSAEIGLRYKSGQTLSLGPYCTLKIGTAIHELLHVLGFYHEHTRQDRSGYIELHLENADSTKLSNFNTVSDTYVDRTEEYDCASVTHYSAYSFSIDKVGQLKTISGLTSECEQKMGQRDGLSDLDKLKLVDTYGDRSCRPR